ncbi:hypothetical protein [Gordonia bronchialis]|uniref:hypothetical protein n=1 Tax=Gordonia bronchialis TaxID=2054 RepID=UPI00226D5C2F|nr:hypothetical protein [Gordonia bronchialis]
MACCIVAALLISLYHRLAPRRARRADLDVGFAPAASRPAPGHGTGDHRTVRVTHDLGTRAAVAGWTLRFVAVGIAVYLPLSALLLAARVAEGDASTLSCCCAPRPRSSWPASRSVSRRGSSDVATTPSRALRSPGAPPWESRSPRSN